MTVENPTPLSFEHIKERLLSGQTIRHPRFEANGEPAFLSELWFKKQFANMVAKRNLTPEQERALCALVDANVKAQRVTPYRPPALTEHEEHEIARWVGDEIVEDLVLRIRIATVMAKRSSAKIPREQELRHVANIRKLLFQRTQS